MVLVFGESFGLADLIGFAAEAAYTKRTLKRGLQALVPKIFISNQREYLL